jgi:hypothetical protein
MFWNVFALIKSQETQKGQFVMAKIRLFFTICSSLILSTLLISQQLFIKMKEQKSTSQSSVRTIGK